MVRNTRLGDFLLERELVTKKQLDEALAKQGDSPKALGQILVEMKILKEPLLARILAEQLEIPYIDLLTTPLQPNAVDLIPEHLARRHACIPVGINNGSLTVAMCDPLDLDALEELGKTAKLEIKPLISTRADILESIELQYFTRNYRASHAHKLEREIQAEINDAPISKKEARTFAIISNKGGVGKTHTAVNLAAAFSSMRMKTLLIDIDLGNANVGVKIGTYPKNTLMNFLNEDKDISEIITPTKFGFDLIAGQAGEYKLANLAYLQKLRFIRNFCSVSNAYDAVVFDLGAGIDAGVLDFALAANEVIILTTPQDIVAGYACLKASYYRFKEIEAQLQEKTPDYRQKEVYSPKYIINQVDSPQMAQRVFDKIKTTASRHFMDENRFKLDVGYLGYIPYDRDVIREAEKMRRPYVIAHSNRPVARCLHHIASELLKPSSFRIPMSAAAMAPPRIGSGGEPSTKAEPSKSTFKRFVEILKIKK